MTELRPYECMIIFDADLDEEKIRADVESWLSSLEANGAERGYVDFWGTRRLAYELKHRTEGYYVVFQAKAASRTVEELSRTLSLDDGVLRHKVLRVPDEVYGPPTHLSTASAEPERS